MAELWGAEVVNSPHHSLPDLADEISFSATMPPASRIQHFYIGGDDGADLLCPMLMSMPNVISSSAADGSCEGVWASDVDYVDSEGASGTSDVVSFNGAMSGGDWWE